MFQGATALALDAKGRLGIPAKHREVLNGRSQGKLVLTGHPDGCLLLYPAPAWEPIRERTLKFSDLSPRLVLWKRLLVGMASEVEPDGQGRILIAPELRGYAGLEKQVWLVGQGTRFEVWSELKWLQQLERAQQQGAEPLLQDEADFAL